MSGINQTHDHNLSDQLGAVEKRRRALTQLIRIAESIEQLYSALQSALVLGKAGGCINQKTLDSYQQLNGKTKNFSNDKVRALITKLDRAISQELVTVLLLNREEEAGNEGVGYPHKALFSDEQINTLFADFRRNAQTSVALRVLLRERGEMAPVLDLAIREQEILAQVHRLEIKEKACRKKIKEEIIDLQGKIDQLIKNPELPYNLKESAKVVRAGLQHDLEHIIAGRRIESMPTLFEMVELVSDVSQPPEVVDPNVSTVSQLKPSQYQSEDNPPSQRSAWCLIWRWLTSPWSVSWRDINKR